MGSATYACPVADRDDTTEFEDPPRIVDSSGSGDGPLRPSSSAATVAVELLVDWMPQLVWTAEADGTIDHFNARIGSYTGAVQAADGTWRWTSMVHPDDLVTTEHRWRTAVRDGSETFVAEHRLKMADGTYRWHLNRAQRITTADGAIRWCGFATDVHEQKAAEEGLHDALDRLQRLQAVTATLAAPLWEESSVIEALLGEGVRATGGRDGTVLLFDQDGTARTAGASAGEIVASALTEQRIVVRPCDRGVEAAVAFPTALGVIGGLGIRYPDRAELSPYDLAALRTVAELGAQALLRSRAYHDEQRRADQAEALEAFASALAESSTVTAVADAIATHAGRSAGAEFANVALPLAGTDRLRLVHAGSISAEVTSKWSEIALHDSSPLSDAIRVGEPVFVRDRAALSTRYPHLVDASAPTPLIASAAIPMRTQDGTVVGALGFGWFSAQSFATDEIALLETVVSLASQAMQRAAFFEAEQERRRYTELVRNAGMGIAAASSVADVARFIVERGAPALGGARAVIFDLRCDPPVVLARAAPQGHPGVSDRVSGEQGEDDLEHSPPLVSQLDVDERELAVPLVGGEGPLALVRIWLEQPMRWEAHRHRLTGVMLEWTQALERAHAHDLEQLAVRRNDELQRVTAALVHATRSADVVRVVEAQVPRIFGARRATIGVRGDHAGPDDTFIALDGNLPGGEHLVITREAVLDAAERSAAEAFAGQCARALSRTRLSEREHQIATELQHALLGDIDSVECLAAGTVYLASEEGLDIGGDWFDVIRRDDTTAVLVVGDVVGHSLEAAMAMGQLRSAVRALAHLCDTPEVLLAHIDNYAHSVRDAQYSTLVLVYLDMTTGRFRYASAGHPPPLLARHDGTTAFLETASNGPIGTLDTGSVGGGESVIEPGGSLLLYTDGLVEHRGASIDEGLERVALLAGREASLPPELLALRVVDGVFVDVAPRDDVAVLVVSPTMPGARRWWFAADPAQLGVVRAEMRAWLRDNDVAPARVDDMLLIAGEALANAVEHAYHGRSVGGVEVRIERRCDDLRLVVVDRGGWRVPNAPGQRGRGVGIMQALADELIVESREGGTTLFARLRATVD